MSKKKKNNVFGARQGQVKNPFPKDATPEEIMFASKIRDITGCSLDAAFLYARDYSRKSFEIEMEMLANGFRRMESINGVTRFSRID